MTTRDGAICVLFAVCTAPASRAGGNELFEFVTQDPQFGEVFGMSCTVQGSTALIGASSDHTIGVNAGAAYVFDLATGLEIRQLVAPDGSWNDELGFSVALTGDLALVSCWRDDDSGDASGSVYVFDITTGQMVRKLLASDGEAGDYFGYSVAVSGSVAIIGAYGDDDNGDKAGAAYVFDVATGQELFKLSPLDPAEYDLFGERVAIDGTTAVVGSRLDDDLGTLSGSAYVFDVTTGQQIAKLLPSDGDSLDQFGASVAIDGTLIVVGAPKAVNGVPTCGAAYVFDATSGQQIAKLAADDALDGDDVGYSVAISGSIAIVGAPMSDPVGAIEDSGAAYRFNAVTGEMIDKMTPEEPVVNAWFGRSVATEGTRALIGCPLDEGGSTFVYPVGFGTRFCDASDGVLGACPCGNAGFAETGCNNAQGTGGVAIDAADQRTIVNTASLRGSGFSPTAFPAVVLLRSTAIDAASPVAFGDGLRCIDSGSLVRLAATIASSGMSSHNINHGAGPGTFYYQLWYRNTPASFCNAAAAFNLSNGIAMTW